MDCRDLNQIAFKTKLQQLNTHTARFFHELARKEGPQPNRFSLSQDTKPLGAQNSALLGGQSGRRNLTLTAVSALRTAAVASVWRTRKLTPDAVRRHTPPQAYTKLAHQTNPQKFLQVFWTAEQGGGQMRCLPKLQNSPCHSAPPHTGHTSLILTKRRSESIILQISKPNSHELIHHDEELEGGRAGGQNSLNTCHTDHL